MKGKLPSIVMVFVALALVLSAVAVVPNAKDVSADPGVDRWSGMSMPSMMGYTLMPDTNIGPIALADDGTLFATVYDESVGPTPGPTPTPNPGRWGTTLGDSEWAVMYSTDGGYHWTLGFTLPEDDGSGPIVDIVTVPGYTHPGWVYIITEKYVYYSMDGGETFYRTSTGVPGVVTGGGALTSLDVTDCAWEAGEYVAVVGVAGGSADGVYTYNLEGIGIWIDMELANAPAGNGTGQVDYDTYEVAFSPGYAAASPGDLVIVAVARYRADTVNGAHPNPYAGITTTVVTTYAGTLGTWGIKNWDAPLGVSTNTPVLCDWARLDFPGDYHWQSNPYSYVVIEGGSYDDAWRAENWLTSGTMGGRAVRLNMMGGNDVDCDSIAVYGSGLDVQALVGLEDPISGGDQGQVWYGTNLRVFPSWQPSMNPPSGDSWQKPLQRVWVAWDGTNAYAAAGGDGDTMSCWSRGYHGAMGWTWHGTGLVDDIVVSSNILDHGWYYAVPTSLSASPAYAVPGDETFFFTTYSEWAYDKSDEGGLSMWRQSPVSSTEWERVLWQGMYYPSGAMVEGSNDYENTVYEFTYAWFDEMWTVETSPDFELTGHAFLLAGLWSGASDDWIFFTPDRGNTWLPFNNMPLNQDSDAIGSSFCVADYLTVLFGTETGYVYKTADRGASWTDGVITLDGWVTDIAVSPIYSETGASDKAVLAGTWDDDDYAAKVWISLDGAEELFVQVGPEVAYTEDDVLEYLHPVMVAFDQGWGTEASPTNRIVYCAASALLDYYAWDDDILEWILEERGEPGIYRSEVDMDSPQSSSWDTLLGWDDIHAMAPWPPGDESEYRYMWFTDLDVGPHGTLYAPFGLYDEYWDRFTWGGMFRSLDGTLEVTEWNNANQGMQERTGFMFVDVVPGTTHLWSIDIKFEDWDYRIIPKIMMYEDTLCQAGPAVASPLDDATNVGEMVGTKVNVVLDWASVGSTIYQWQVDDDSGFTAPLIAEGTTTETFAQVTGLENAFQYYWRVRVIDPVYSPWSAPQSFTTVIGTAVSAPALLSPEAGATGVALRPTFQWGALGWATSYLIQVATDAGFTDLEIDETATVTAYQPADELDSGTTYYWRVKATSDTAESGWSVGLFTAGPVGDGEPTPYWVWVVIAIGAILAVALLVLIIRTRRPV